MKCIECKLCKRVEIPVYYKIPNGVKCGIQLYFHCDPRHIEIENPFAVRDSKNRCELFEYNEETKTEIVEGGDQIERI